jgi:hypothetical protein
MTKCYWCNKKAEIKDYRDLNGTVHKIPSCRTCFGLKTSYLRKKYENNSVPRLKKMPGDKNVVGKNS